MSLLRISYLLVILVALSSCRAKTTNKAMKRGEKLQSNLDSFEKNRVKLSSKVVESLEEAQTALTAEAPDLPKVSKDFEKEWTSIMKRYEKMKKDFADVGESSDQFFGQLDELSGAINSADLRAKELGKNAELKAKWAKIYKEASVSVNKVTEVLNSGNDFHMVLVASSVRQKIEQNVDDLKVIANQAKTLLKDLEVFTAAGRQLVAGEEI